VFQRFGGIVTQTGMNSGRLDYRATRGNEPMESLSHVQAPNRPGLGSAMAHQWYQL
jgi:hypothetical protein